MWWKILLFFWIAVFSTLAIVVPIAGSIDDARILGGMMPSKEIPVTFTIGDRSAAQPAPDGAGYLVPARDARGGTVSVLLPERPADLDAATGYLVTGRYDAIAGRFIATSPLRALPIISFPFIMGLEERARIILFHVPMAWMTTIAFLVAMWYGIRHLRKRELLDDTRSAVSAGLGLLFCILATVTGSVWAKFNWGSFWNWDPRETSIFVLLLVYGAYFALRLAVEDPEKRARLSAVYSILAFVTVPFLIFIMPRIMPGLHPGSADDTNTGPVLSKQGMDAMMRVVLYSMLAGFIVLYTWLMKLRLRVLRLEEQS